MTETKSKFTIAQCHTAVSNAIKAGILIKPDQCQICENAGPIHAAHHSYDEPLRVEWLCASCHRHWDLKVKKTKPMDHKRTVIPIDFRADEKAVLLKEAADLSLPLSIYLKMLIKTHQNRREDK